MLVLSIVTVHAYGAGGGYVYVFSNPDTSKGNSLTHQTLSSGTEIEFKSTESKSLVDSYTFDLGNRYFNVYLDIYEVEKDKIDTGLSDVYKVMKFDTNVGSFEKLSIMFRLPDGFEYKLLHEIDGKWIEEPIRHVKTINGFRYYEANINQFSMFAITRTETPEKPKQTELTELTRQPETPKEKPVIKEPEIKEPAPTPPITGQAIKTQETKNQGKTIFIILVGWIVCILIGVGIYYWNVERKKKTDE